MKIVLVNYRYFVDGGPGRYMFNIKEILEHNGHQVIPFSIKNSKNSPSEYEKYFLSSVNDEEYFADTKKTPTSIIKSFGRMFYSFEAKKKFKRLLNDTRPDLIYILQFHNKISPSILYPAKKAGIPIVHRISDFQYMCPNALFYNDVVGICEECLKGNWKKCIEYKCVLDSKLYSGIKALAKRFHDRLKITELVDRFIVPSSFTVSKLRQYGIPKEKLNHIPTFFNLKEQKNEITYQPFFLFIGRLEKQKGLKVLIDAFIDTPYNLKIIGFSSSGYDKELQDYLKDKKHNIEFLGRKSFEEIVPYLSSCRCTIVPSEWYDNFPNSILESMAFHKAVITTGFGSLVELIKDSHSGLTFKYKDIADLRRCIKYMYENPDKAKEMGDNAYEDLVKLYSPELHYNRLIAIFNSLIKTQDGI